MTAGPGASLTAGGGAWTDDGAGVELDAGAKSVQPKFVLAPGGKSGGESETNGDMVSGSSVGGTTTSLTVGLRSGSEGVLARVGGSANEQILVANVQEGAITGELTQAHWGLSW